MISCRAGHDTAGKRRLGEGRHFVVRTADFEGEDWLGILSLEKDGVVE